MAANKTSNGQIVQIARGNLKSRLQSKPLAYGELFVHTVEKLDNVTGIHDLVTDSDIKVLFKGDLFVGNNSSTDVFAIGSGGSLKWGGVLFGADSYATAVIQVKAFPNHIFMYNGVNPLLYTENETNALKESYTYSEAQPDKVDKKYIASSSNEYNNRINPGDLIFYSPAIDQIIVIHLNHSTDALTKINVDTLVSESMKNLLTESEYADYDTAEHNRDKTSSTLKTFLDGPVRHFQYLTDTYGWEPVTIETEAVINRNADAAIITTTNGTITLASDGDGYIHYVPFSTTSPGQMKYSGANITGLEDETLYEGDLIFSIPIVAAGKGTVTHKKISLYGALLDILRVSETYNRADQYATDIWSIGIDGEDGYVGDRKYFAQASNLKDFIKRLFETKVDVDPITKKIISSQLPDYILGAPKYMGHVTMTSENWDALSPDTTAQSFAKALLANSDTIDWENLDKSEDDTTGTDVTYKYTKDDPVDYSNGKYVYIASDNATYAEGYYEIANDQVVLTNKDTSTGTTTLTADGTNFPGGTYTRSLATNTNNVADSATVNEKLKAGCYWIYTGDTYDISSFTQIFHLDAVKDDLAGGQTTNVEGADIAQHLLNKGDWIIYNGESQLFEIIDNTASFVGLLVDSIKVAGVVSFLHPERSASTLVNRWVNGTKTETSVKAEETHFEADATSVAFSNPDAVLFRNKTGTNTKTSLVDENYLPLINSDGYAFNSRFQVISDQTGLATAWGTDASDATNIARVQFLLHLDESSLTDADKEISWKSKYWHTINADYTVETLKTNRIYSTADGQDGFNFQWIKFMGDSTAYEDTTLYSFTLPLEINPKLALPQHSGTLATEKYVNTGFTVVKAIINDLYDAILDSTVHGHEDWIQTIKSTGVIDPRTGNERKKIFDSKIKQTFTAGVSLLLDLYYNATNTNSDAENQSDQFARLSVYNEITTTLAKKFDAPIDVSLGTANNVTTLNNSTRASNDAVENVLPNHSGILLNNNSVIDGGEWL